MTYDRPDAAPRAAEGSNPAPAPDAPPGPPRSGGHFPELDGVRGLAIAMVFAFHYVAFKGSGPLATYLGGAVGSLWCGVDLFFVLSGFLITGILLDARGRPSYFTTFYARRTLRIFPLYFGLLGFVFLVLPWLVPMTGPADRTMIANQGWLWAYATNFRSMVVGHRVFAGEHVWLHHLWSLAVEEHFYLVWPFVVGLAATADVRRACWACLAICPLIRVGLMATPLPPLAACVATFCRLDALALGGLLALFVRGEVPGLSRRMIVTTAALAATAMFGLFLKDRWLDPEDLVVRTAGYSLLALASAGLILAAISGRVDGPLRRVLRLRPLRELGKYSYGLYVYHVALQPSLGFLSTESLQKAGVRSFALAGLLHVAATLAFCLGTAMLSWHLFERPFLSLKRRFEYKGR